MRLAYISRCRRLRSTLHASHSCSPLRSCLRIAARDPCGLVAAGPGVRSTIGARRTVVPELYANIKNSRRVKGDQPGTAARSAFFLFGPAHEVVEVLACAEPNIRIHRQVVVAVLALPLSRPRAGFRGEPARAPAAHLTNTFQPLCWPSVVSISNVSTLRSLKVLQGSDSLTSTTTKVESFIMSL